MAAHLDGLDVHFIHVKWYGRIFGGSGFGARECAAVDHEVRPRS